MKEGGQREDRLWGRKRVYNYVLCMMYYVQYDEM